MATEDRARFGINVHVEVTDFTRELLIGSGWTPPGEDPILNSEHRRILADRAARHNAAMSDLRTRHQVDMAKLQTQHRATLRQQADNHQRIMGLEEKRIREEYSARGRHDGCVTWADHTAALRDHAGYIRRVVAEEIAVDLEKPREWRITLDKPGPWGAIARKHAGGKPSELPFPPDQITWTGPKVMATSCPTCGCTMTGRGRTAP